MAADTYERLAGRYDRMYRENPVREAFFRKLFTKQRQRSWRPETERRTDM